MTEVAPATVLAVVTDENAAPEQQPASDVTPTEKTNGEAKKKKEEKVVAPPEPPKDPKEDLSGWMKQQIPDAVHKINYSVLDWAQKLAIEDESQRQKLPGRREGYTTKSEFVAFLCDGSLLASLAKKLTPDAVETVHPKEEAIKEKEKQTSNLQAFANFVKEKVGLPEEQVFSIDELQKKGKAGYDAVFTTLLQVALNAEEKFNAIGVTIDGLVEEASKAVKASRLQNLLATVQNLFNKAASPAGKGIAQPQENGNKKNADAAATIDDKVVEEKPEEHQAKEEQVKKVEFNQQATTLSQPQSATSNGGTEPVAVNGVA